MRIAAKATPVFRPNVCCPLRAFDFLHCDIGHHANPDASQCIIYNRARLAKAEQMSILLNLTPQNRENAAAARRWQMIALEKAEAALNRTQAEKDLADLFESKGSPTSAPADIFAPPPFSVENELSDLFTPEPLEVINGNESPKKGKAIPRKVKNEVWTNHFGESTKGACFCCKCDLDALHTWHAGHIIAKSKGGLDSASNLRPVCGSCNQSMGSENMDTFKARCYS